MMTSPIDICVAAYLSLPVLGRVILNRLQAGMNPELFIETSKRIRTWGIILLVLSGSALLGKSGMLWFFGLVSFLAFKEYISIIPTRPKDRRTLFWAYLSYRFNIFLSLKAILSYL